jgi:esterase
MKLATTSYGEKGSPVVVLHGLFGSGRNWMTAGRRLASDHRVIAVDQRNHGTSAHTESMSYPEMAADVYDTITDLGLGSVALMGHSMGGKAAMVTALQHPEMVDRLIVVDASPVAYPPVLASYVQAMRAVDLASVQRRSDVDKHLVDVVPDAGTRAFLLQNLIIDDEGARWRLNLPVLEAAMPTIAGWPDDLTGSYDGPTLFVFGGKSDYVRPEYHDAILRYFPRAQFVEIPEAGHWVHAERLDDFLGTVAPFLAP